MQKGDSGNSMKTLKEFFALNIDFLRKSYDLNS